MPQLNVGRLHLRSFADTDLDAFATLVANDGLVRFSDGSGIDRANAAATMIPPITAIVVPNNPS